VLLSLVFLAPHPVSFCLKLRRLIGKKPTSEDVGGFVLDRSDQYDDPNDPSLKLILIHTHLALHRFTKHVRLLVEEDPWKDTSRELLQAIMDSHSRTKASA